MRKIYKTISLEPMTSRLPSVIPAYVQGSNTPITFDDDQLKARGYSYTSNYGLIPCSVMLNGRKISFERLSIWYHKFKEYYNLLNNYGHCGVKYGSATAYYDNESKKYPDDLYYGNSRETYVNLDSEISAMGGLSTYAYIREYFVPEYIIPTEYQDYWGRTMLYYPDVIKWIGWFKERYDKYGANPNCKNTSDCCDCTEYLNRGGYNMIDINKTDSMTSWYERIQSKIPTSVIPPNIISPIEIQNSIEDLGEFTIFCEEYKVGIDYRVANGYGDTANTRIGTSVIKDDKVQKLVNGKGYTFDDVYMENVVDNDAWTTKSLSNTSTTYTAYTSSKLKFIHLDNYLTDDVGNIIEGIYDVGSNANHQPKEGTVLEPLYQIGAISNVTNVDGHDDMFKGDVINSMTFYYKTVDGEIDGNTSGTVNTSGVSIANTISALTTHKDDYKIYDDDIYCDVNYNVGNIYVLYETIVEGKKVQRSRVANKTLDGFDGSGITYTETVQFEKARVEYYLKQRVKGSSPSDVRKLDVHSISYPIYVYRLKQKEELIDDNSYNTTYIDNLSSFTIKADRKYDNDYESSGDTKAPIIREEYRVGVSAKENIKGNIYIDRGINSAFEKHLKLGEVASLEALENYGNNFFKIMDV